MLDEVDPDLTKLFDAMAKNLKKDDARLLSEMLDELRKDV